MSAQDAIADFISFMEANGVEPAEPIAQRLASGSLIRFRCEGDGNGRKNGWAILYLDERPAGAFGNYKLNTGTLKWKSSEDRPTLSREERETLQREWREAKERREGEKRDAERQAALDAADLWAKALPASHEHGYVAAKRINPKPLRQRGNGLLVPMADERGNLWNLQSIAPDGTKRFLRGGRIDGLFAIIGQFTPTTKEAIFVEGYATGDTAHRATGIPVIVAFNTSNLPKVARLWAEKRPDLEFTVFADDDEATARANEERTGKYSNPGIETAEAVAAEIGASIAYPMGAPTGRAA